jgi:hypothetical protein
MTEVLLISYDRRHDLCSWVATWNTELADRVGNAAKAIARRMTKLRSPLKTDIDWRNCLSLQTGNKAGDKDAVHDMKCKRPITL